MLVMLHRDVLRFQADRPHWTGVRTRGSDPSPRPGTAAVDLGPAELMRLPWLSEIYFCWEGSNTLVSFRCFGEEAHAPAGSVHPRDWGSCAGKRGFLWETEK